jgi:hypothetical protein
LNCTANNFWGYEVEKLTCGVTQTKWPNTTGLNYLWGCIIIIIIIRYAWGCIPLGRRVRTVRCWPVTAQRDSPSQQTGRVLRDIDPGLGHVACCLTFMYPQTSLRPAIRHTTRSVRQLAPDEYTCGNANRREPQLGAHRFCRSVWLTWPSACSSFSDTQSLRGCRE